jgi:tRNA threonylcarbamoyladenosine modification (KEOPS) complex Cgi121 subunit
LVSGSSHALQKKTPTQLVLRGFSDTDAINQVIDLAAKKGDEKAVTKLVEKMKQDGIAINKRTVLVLRQFATKLVSSERAEIEQQEARELADLDAQLAKN